MGADTLTLPRRAMARMSACCGSACKEAADWLKIRFFLLFPFVIARDATEGEKRDRCMGEAQRWVDDGPRDISSDIV